MVSRHHGTVGIALLHQMPTTTLPQIPLVILPKHNELCLTRVVMEEAFLRYVGASLDLRHVYTLHVVLHGQSIHIHTLLLVASILVIVLHSV